MLAAALAPAALAAQFAAVKPGGNTSCARGGEFAFMHRAGTVNKVVIEFEGGGACWSGLTCNPIQPACTQDVDVDGKLSYLNGANSGMHDDEARNPFHGWHHLFVPYCTCDGHTGTRDHNYGLSGTVQHRGHINFQAALAWMRGNFPQSPDAVATTGCSAGSVGALALWPFLAQAYPDAKQYVFGDSYVGVFAEEQYNDGFANWGMQFASWVPGYTADKLQTWHAGMGCYLHSVAANYYPQASLGWYTSNADQVQSEFYSVGGGKDSWTSVMRTHVACLHQGSQNERTFIAAGDAHCRSQDDGFYSVSAAGANLAQWVSDIVQGKDAADVVDCASSGECNTTSLAATAGPILKPGAGYQKPYRH